MLLLPRRSWEIFEILLRILWICLQNIIKRAKLSAPMKNQSLTLSPKFLGIFLAASGALMAAPTSKQGNGLHYYNREETRGENPSKRAVEERVNKSPHQITTSVRASDANLGKQIVTTSKTETKTQNHGVKSGDTISKIARKYNTTPAKLMKLNGLTERSVLRVGQSLKVTSATSTATTTKKPTPPEEARDDSASSGSVRHEVRRGETVAKLARTYGISMDSIINANNLRTGATLLVGRVITVPTRDSATQKNSPVKTKDQPTAAQRQSYEIRGKDTFYSLATQNGISVEELQAANPGVSPDRLRPGMSIKIPVRNSRAVTPAPEAIPEEVESPSARDLHTRNQKNLQPVVKNFEPVVVETDKAVVQRNAVDAHLDYTVEPGDTWETIGGQFRTTSTELKRINGGRADQEPVTGSTILVPRSRFLKSTAPAGSKLG